MLHIRKEINAAICDVILIRSDKKFYERIMRDKKQSELKVKLPTGGKIVSFVTDNY